jgi:hypothetical protein
MVYGTQNYWVSVRFPSSGVFGSKNTTFRKLGLSPSSDERGGEKTFTQSGPLKKLISITQTLSDLRRYIITRDQANSAGDNKKVYNKSTHMRGTGLEKEMEICATNVTN